MAAEIVDRGEIEVDRIDRLGCCVGAAAEKGETGRLAPQRQGRRGFEVPIGQRRCRFVHFRRLLATEKASFRPPTLKRGRVNGRIIRAACHKLDLYRMQGMKLARIGGEIMLNEVRTSAMRTPLTKL